MREEEGAFGESPSVGRGNPRSQGPVEFFGRSAVAMSKALPKSGSALSLCEVTNGRLRPAQRSQSEGAHRVEIAVIVLVLLAFGFWHAAKKEATDKARRIYDEEMRDTAEAELEQSVRNLLAIHVVEHERTLLTKRRQTIFADDYGVEDRSRWNQELRYFVDRVCDPSILEYHKERCHLDETPYVLIGMEIEELLDAGGGSAEPADYRVDMAGVEFERLVAERLVGAGADVRFTPATGDQGADLIVEHNGETIVVQCKRSASTVGNKAVQEAYAGRKFHDAEQAWVVSDAPFSRAARQLASSLSVRLVDFDQVEAAL